MAEIVGLRDAPSPGDKEATGDLRVYGLSCVHGIRWLLWECRCVFTEVWGGGG